MKELFANREKEYPGQYGGGANKQIIHGNQSSGNLDLTIFNKDILKDHQSKCQSICGAYLGFRGRGEHGDLNSANFEQGRIEDGHEFATYPFVGVKDMPDKSNVLSMTNVHLQKTGHMQLPVLDMEDMSNPGATLVRYINKQSQGHERFYCYEATPKQKSMWAKDFPNAVMGPKIPIGVNAIAAMMKEANK